MTSAIGQPRLLSLNASENVIPSALVPLPHVVSLNRIDTLRLSSCRSSIDVDLPALRHIILNSLNSFCSFPSSVCSIQLVLYYEDPPFVAFDWSALHSLAALPMLKSLHILVYDMDTKLEDTTCQIIADAVPKLVDFQFCFRRLFNRTRIVWDFLFNDYQIFIEHLHRRILLLSVDRQPYCVVEQDGCGLTVWF